MLRWVPGVKSQVLFPEVSLLPCYLKDGLRHLLLCFSVSKSRRGKWTVYLAGTFIKAFWECRGLKEECCLMLAVLFQLGHKF